MSGSVSDSVFPRIWPITARYEGDTLDRTYSDKGNWTGGRVGSGTLVGSKFGISAASYPEVDIASLTSEQAMQIAQTDFWAVIRGDDLPPALALLVFDAAYNHGPRAAGDMLQQSVGAACDGVIGPMTLALTSAWAAKSGVASLCAEFQARRIEFMADTPEWLSDALGFSRRLAGLLIDAIPFLPPPTSGAA